MSSCISIGMKSIEGDENVITKEIDVTSFDEIEVVGGVQVFYTQAKGSPKLSVKVDQNIYDLYMFRVKDRTLQIRPKELNLNIQATCFEVSIQSDQLKDIEIAGSTVVNLLSAITGSSLDIEIAGSGRVVAKDRLSVDEIDIVIAGSGRVNASMLQVDDLDVSIAGSGSVLLAGSANEVDCDIAGSGRLESLELRTNRVDISIAGSGNVSVFAAEELDVDIAGSGRVRYKGSPNIRTNIAGSGRLQRIIE